MFKDIFTNKKKLITVIIAAMLIIVVLVFGLFNMLDNDKNNVFKDEYESLNNVATEDGKKYPRVVIPEDNKIKYASYEEVIDIFNKNGDAVVYFGYPTCLYCRTAIQVLLNVSEETEISEILYLDVEKKDERYDELLGKLGDEFKTEQNEIYSPLVIFVADGNIVSYNKGTLFSQEDPYQELDQSQINGLSHIYKSGIQDVLNAMRNN